MQTSVDKITAEIGRTLGYTPEQVPVFVDAENGGASSRDQVQHLNQLEINGAICPAIRKDWPPCALSCL